MRPANASSTLSTTRTVPRIISDSARPFSRVHLPRFTAVSAIIIRWKRPPVAGSHFPRTRFRSELNSALRWTPKPANYSGINRSRANGPCFGAYFSSDRPVPIYSVYFYTRPLYSGAARDVNVPSQRGVQGEVLPSVATLIISHRGTRYACSNVILFQGLLVR